MNSPGHLKKILNMLAIELPLSLYCNSTFTFPFSFYSFYSIMCVFATFVAHPERKFVRRPILRTETYKPTKNDLEPI